jgi:hypothetical protein
MAKATKTKELVKAPNQGMTEWEKELALAAQEGAETVAGLSSSSFISIRNGVMSVNGAPVPGNQIVVVITDFVLENTFYPDGFDPDDVVPPTCYAFGRKAKEMGPHDDAEAKQNELCVDCPHNAWGSAEKGRGKACKNRARLMVVSAGDLSKDEEFTPFEDAGNFTSQTQMTLKIPPTSLSSFKEYVDKLKNTALRPCWAVYTLIKVVPDPKNQFVVTFQDVDKPSDRELLTVLKKLHEDATKVIEQPYTVKDEEEAPAPKKGGVGKGVKVKSVGRGGKL